MHQLRFPLLHFDTLNSPPVSHFLGTSFSSFLPVSSSSLWYLSVWYLWFLVLSKVALFPVITVSSVFCSKIIFNVVSPVTVGTVYVKLSLYLYFRSNNFVLITSSLLLSHIFVRNLQPILPVYLHSTIDLLRSGPFTTIRNFTNTQFRLSSFSPHPTSISVLSYTLV